MHVFQHSKIDRHLAKIFESGELDEEVVVAKIATTTQHGAMQDKTQTIPTNYYNLDAIISVGCRVNSIQTTKFLLYTKMAHSILTLNKSTNLFLHTHSQT